MSERRGQDSVTGLSLNCDVCSKSFACQALGHCLSSYDLIPTPRFFKDQRYKNATTNLCNVEPRKEIRSAVFVVGFAMPEQLLRPGSMRAHGR